MSPYAPLKPEAPKRLADYELLGRLGEGGQGVVYLAAAEPDQQVAIKLLRPEVSFDPDIVQRFLREARVAERVAAFCTAQVLSTGVEAGRPFIVSEYIEGPSLRQVIEKDGPRSGGGLHRLAVSTLTALAAIHQAGIVHRDFKPSNVIIGTDGPRVVDFGIARALDATSTLTSSVLGTPAYVSPEQFLGQPVEPDGVSGPARLVRRRPPLLLRQGAAEGDDPGHRLQGAVRPQARGPDDYPRLTLTYTQKTT